MKSRFTCMVLAFFCVFVTVSGRAQTVIGHIYKNVPDLTERDVRGSRYLFDTSWVKGNVVAADNRIINNDSMLYNFDKIDQSLFLTTDRKLVYEVDKNEFKSVTFYHNDTVFVFEKVPVINENSLFQVLAYTPDKYGFYKQYHTIYKKANYTTNGISESGNKYDEYIDDASYYIVFPNKEYHLLPSLKKSAVEKVFALNPDKEKASSFLSSNKGGKSPEGNIKDLVNFLNGNPAAK